METPTFIRLPYIDKVLDRVADPTDSAEVTRIKATMVGNTMFIQLNGYILAALYYYFDEPLAAGILLAANIIGLLGLAHFISTRNISLGVSTSLVILLLAPFFLTLALGGFVNSSVAIIFSAIFIPTSAVALGRSHQAARWYLAAVILLILAGILQAYLRGSNNLPPILVDPILFVVNIGVLSGLLFGALSFIVRDRDRAHKLLEKEQERSEQLLLNVLPDEIVPILKAEGGTIAEHFESVSVLFADIVGFTPLSAQWAPAKMVDVLNEIFSEFDGLVENYDLEKIRTIGDNYMVASGVPRPRKDHALAIANLALEMEDYIEAFPAQNGNKIAFRVGINSGPVVAGVIGRHKFHYDLWGDTVNTASRMESHGVAGKIQFTRATYELLSNDFNCEARGMIQIKGKGEMETWFLIGQK